jgi:hemerythrin-like metal-binding protein
MWVKEWNTSFSVNVKKFDDKHMRIFELINELHASMKEGKGSSIIMDTLNSLISYTDTHFVEEEQLMFSTDYPNRVKHLDLHIKIITNIYKLKQEFTSGVSDIVPVKTLGFLNDLLVNHIKIEDKKYSTFFNDKGIC